MQNKVVCISGVSKGLGHALAKEFDLRGWRIAGCARSNGALIDLGKDLQNKHFIQKADITQQSDVQTFTKKVLSTLGVPSLLLNNAGKINKNALMSYAISTIIPNFVLHRYRYLLLQMQE